MQIPWDQAINLGGFLGILSFIAYTIYMDWRRGSFKNPTDIVGRDSKLQDGMDYLKMHFNDELTAILTQIQVSQVEMKDILKDIERNGVRIRK